MHTGKTFKILTHGCKVNQYESEAIAEAFSAEGLVHTDSNADVVVINTCTVTKEATATCRQTINKVLRESPNAAVLVVGCFSQVMPNEAENLKGVDYIGGSANKMQVVSEALELLKNGKRAHPRVNVLQNPEDAGFEKTEIRSFPRTRAYIKIEDGCNNRCAYCIIPKARGRVRSKAPDDVISEIRLLSDSGVPEVVLTGIETDAYGLDLDSYRLPDLIEDIERKTEMKRIRLGSLDPFTFTDEFIRRVCKKEIMLPHYHISMQSGCSKTLREMRRRVNAKRAEEIISNIRNAREDVQFSADFIVGFPGETDEDFEETLEFVKRQRFLHLHVFKYSIREGTEAAERKDRVLGEIKQIRSKRLIEAGEKIKEEILSENVGKAFPLLIETIDEKDGKYLAHGHTPSFLEAECLLSEKPKRGDIISVLAVSSTKNVLICSPID